MPCVNPRQTEIIARGRCILRNFWRSFLRNRPVRKVVKTKLSVVIPRGSTREDNEKELWSLSSRLTSSFAKAFSLKANPQKINAKKSINMYGFISIPFFNKSKRKVESLFQITGVYRGQFHPDKHFQLGQFLLIVCNSPFVVQLVFKQHALGIYQ